ncbi:hypothetical protein HELRODRAFT_140023, partial [Helobdella robusta]|uniref:Tetraspanin n=1 Tax=Helobdella robusta TaxID=6412 RepID=T1EIZ9_HELRO
SLNLIQLTYRCCGASGYTDWFKERWVLAEHFYDNPKTAEALENTEAGKVLVFSTPFSCCDPYIQRPCIFSNVVNDSLHYNYKHNTDLTIFKVGCGHAIAESLGAVWMFIVRHGFVYAALFESCVLVLFRYLQTSVNMALKFGDPTLTAQG